MVSLLRESINENGRQKRDKSNGFHAFLFSFDLRTRCRQAARDKQRPCKTIHYYSNTFFLFARQKNRTRFLNRVRFVCFSVFCRRGTVDFFEIIGQTDLGDSTARADLLNGSVGRFQKKLPLLEHEILATLGTTPGSACRANNTFVLRFTSAKWASFTHVASSMG